MPVMTFLTTCIFDSGALKQLPNVAKSLGITRPFIVTDPGIKAAGLLAKVEDALGMAPAGVFADTVPNPLESQAKLAAEAYKECGADGLIAVGGGSSMDHAKAIGLLVSHPDPLETYAAISGGAKKIKKIPDSDAMARESRDMMQLIIEDRHVPGGGMIGILEPNPQIYANL